MSSSQDVYRRVGRGGAGNWYSKQDVEDADKAQLEVKHPNKLPQPRNSATKSVLTLK